MVSVPQQVHVDNFRVFEEAIQSESVELHKLDIMHIAQAQARFYKFYVYVTIDFDAIRVRAVLFPISILSQLLSQSIIAIDL